MLFVRFILNECVCRRSINQYCAVVHFLLVYPVAYWRHSATLDAAISVARSEAIQARAWQSKFCQMHALYDSVDAGCIGLMLYRDTT